MLKLLLMISLYYPLSVGLTFYQKWFIKVFYLSLNNLTLYGLQGYRLPLLIVSGHYVIKFFIAIALRFLLELYHKNRRVRLPIKEQLWWLMPVGVCASLDIGLSNWALEYMTISLYTMAKSRCLFKNQVFAITQIQKEYFNKK